LTQGSWERFGLSNVYYPPRPHFPLVVVLLAGAIVVAFVLTGQWDDQRVNALAMDYGVLPIRYDATGPAPYPNTVASIVPLFTHMFIHGGLPHILMNMIGFFQAAPFLATRMGGLRFLVLYFLSGIGGALAFILLGLHSETVMVGASGAICGVFGAYFLAVRPTPQAALADPQVRNAIITFLGINVVLMAFLHLPIAWQAHLGGFIAGALLYVPLKPPVRSGPWGTG
jgi:membrane associated rhomboid family serine protease